MAEDTARMLAQSVEGLEGDMVETLSRLVEIPATGPRNGGEGEMKRAGYLVELLSRLGFDDVERHDSPDPDVPSGSRPNIVATLRGDGPADGGVIWVITHTDIVPEGDPALWTTPPFEPSLRDGKLYGRGTEDNGQDLVASLYGLKALKDLGLKPERDVRLAFVADEETGSDHGIQHLLTRDLFKREDLIVVPDYGEADGTVMEVAEKSIMWLRVTVRGRSVHASMPQLGLNANRAAARYALALDEMLHGEYDGRDDLFVPPESTFEPTKREPNVDNVNTLPGNDVSYFDCRILPVYDIGDVMARTRALADDVGGETGAKITVDLQQGEQAAPATPPDSPVVRRLGRAIGTMAGIQARPGGIGGGTCGAFFRRAGMDAVVWASLEETGHQPDEYSRVSNMVRDARVFAGFYMGI